MTNWQLGFSGGTVLLGEINNEPPLIFDRISVNFRFDTQHKQVVLKQADFSNSEIGFAATGSIETPASP